MVKGIGTDIIEIDRIEKAINREAFLTKMFHNREIDYFKMRNMKPEFIAGRFAAKEAIVKALGTGFRGIKFKDIIVDRNSLGKPIVVLKGEAEKIASKYGEYTIHISISHGRDNAIAYAIWEVKNESFKGSINKGN